jgi:O-antigen/teichoic acid export membrane protein
MPAPRRSASTLAQALPVVIGLGIQAVTAYATLILAGRILGAAEFAGLAALYTLLASVGTGLFQPLEQEVARRRGQERETGQVERTLLRRALVFGLTLCLFAVLVALGLHGATVRLLGERPQLLAALCVALPGYALCFVCRGALSGRRRLVRYGLQLSVEGTFRLLGLGVLTVVGVHSAAAYGWLFALAPWVAVAVSVAGLRPGSPQSTPDGSVATSPVATLPANAGRARPLVAPLLLLLASTLAAQLLIGAGPVTAQLFAGAADKARAGAFLAALVVVRLPVILFAAIQPSLLPAMASHVAAGRKAAFTSVLGKVLIAMCFLGVVTVVGTSALGPWGLTVLFGPDYVLPSSVFLLMGLSVGLYMVSGVLGQAILALGEHRFVAAGWLVGLVGLGLGTALADDAILKATLGLLVGAAAVAATFTAILLLALHRWHPAPTIGGAVISAPALAPADLP